MCVSGQYEIDVWTAVPPYGIEIVGEDDVRFILGSVSWSLRRAKMRVINPEYIEGS